MDSSNLQILSNIQKELKSSGYYDISRISKEILEYITKEDVGLDEVLSRIKNGEPWEYVRGWSEFRGDIFYVTNETLIPRVETEQIVDIGKDIIADNPQIKSVVDVGTGTGCILISLLKDLQTQSDTKDINFVGLEIQDSTLEVAKRNSVLHKVNDNVSFLKSNLLENHSLDQPTLLIANLPYVPTNMYEDLEESVKEFEPRLAIDGGKDGLEIYRALKAEIESKRFDNEIFLLIEIEPSTLNNAKESFSEYSTKVFKDFRQKDRFLLVHFS